MNPLSLWPPKEGLRWGRSSPSGSLTSWVTQGGQHAPRWGRRAGHRAALTPSTAPHAGAKTFLLQLPQSCPVPTVPLPVPCSTATERSIIIHCFIIIGYFDLLLLAILLLSHWLMHLLCVSRAPGTCPGHIWLGCTLLDPAVARREAGSPTLLTTPLTETHREPGWQREVSKRLLCSSVLWQELKPCFQKK